MAGPDTNITELLDALETGLVVLDSEGCVAAWNAWMACASGVEANDARGAQLEAIFTESDFRRLRAAVADAIESGLSTLLTHTLHPRLFPLRTRAGRPMLHNTTVLPLGDKPHTRCLVQVVDVTVAAERERVLRERQNARYAAVVDSAPDAILTLDRDGVIQLASPAAARQFGYSREELIGSPVGMLLEDSEAWEAAWRCVLDAGALHSPVELVARRKDGAQTRIEVSASRWTSRSELFVTAILRDVNERHAAAEALRRLNETLEDRVATALAERKLLADLVETTTALIQVVGPDYSLLAINRASAQEFERLFGPRPAVGDNLLELLAQRPATQAELKALWDRALAGEEFTTLQELTDPSDARRWFELKFNALRDASGEQIAAFQFVYDVTARIESQQQLAQTQEALRQSQKLEAMGQLTGGVAHDFNNLLTPIIGSLDMLLQRKVGDERAQRMMNGALQSAERAKTLVQRLLAFARRQPLQPTAVDVGALVEGMADLIASTSGPQVRVLVDVEKDLPPAKGDLNQLEMAILNLAVNARDAMPDGGVLTISAAAEAVSAEHRSQLEPGKYVRLAVSDSGLGMDEATLQRAIEPFFSTKGVGKGTGLGLSMVHGLASQLGGVMSIASKPGLGTTVELWLPVSSQQVQPAEAGVAAAHGPHKAGVALLVDDEEMVRMSTAAMLSELGYEVVEAGSAREALQMLDSGLQIDALLTDHLMPGLTGVELARAVWERRPGLPTLLLSGYADIESLDPDLPRLGKPFRQADLAASLATVTAGSRRRAGGRA